MTHLSRGRLLIAFTVTGLRWHAVKRMVEEGGCSLVLAGKFKATENKAVEIRSSQAIVLAPPTHCDCHQQDHKKFTIVSHLNELHEWTGQ